MELQNRIVVVTGASAGIGAATASLMASRGARVAMVARRERVLREVAARLGGQATVYPCDVVTRTPWWRWPSRCRPSWVRRTSSSTTPAPAGWRLRGFDECLAIDLRDTGVGVTAVVAGLTESDYFDVNPGALERLPWLARYYRRLTPEEVAAMIVRGVEEERRTVVEPLEIRLTNAAARLVPRGIARLLSAVGPAAKRPPRVRTG
jgi:short-subunit dehydrogenase